MRRAFVLSALTPTLVAQDPDAYKREMRYAQSVLLDALSRGERPIHGALDMVRLLCDIDANRQLVDQLLEAQAAWLDTSNVVVVYSDLDITPGMQLIIDLAKSWDIEIEYRALPDYAAESATSAPAYVN